MAAVEGVLPPPPMSWEEDLASLMRDTGVRYPDMDFPDSPPTKPPEPIFHEHYLHDDIFAGAAAAAATAADHPEESFRDQVAGFLASSVEMMKELGRSCWDIAHQALDGVEDTAAFKKIKGHAVDATEKLGFLNEYLPEDRDPAHAWPVVIFVALVAILVLVVNTEPRDQVEPPKIIHTHPPSAARIQLPDGRFLAYQELGVAAERARFSMIAPHSFLSSRLAGLPGMKESLLQDFGIRMITYDLPGFGESDPHPTRNLNSSALDMLELANALGVPDKFWVLGYSSGGMHAWSALRYIPQKVAGAAMFAPLANPYDAALTKEEKAKIWSIWTTKRKFMFILARRFPSLLSFLYRRSILSGKHDEPEKWLSLSLGIKDKFLLKGHVFKEFWERDVEESVRQGDSRPFIEEAVLQVSNWGFSLSDIQVLKRRKATGLLPWIKSFYSQEDPEWTGFLGPIHIWQGMDDQVVPPTMTEFVRRVIPGATVHRLFGEGHFSYFCFCDECHRNIFSTIFGVPQGPLEPVAVEEEISLDGEGKEEVEEAAFNDTKQD